MAKSMLMWVRPIIYQSHFLNKLLVSTHCSGVSSVPPSRRFLHRSCPSSADPSPMSLFCSAIAHVLLLSIRLPLSLGYPLPMPLFSVHPLPTYLIRPSMVSLGPPSFHPSLFRVLLSIHCQYRSSCPLMVSAGPFFPFMVSTGPSSVH